MEMNLIELYLLNPSKTLILKGRNKIKIFLILINLPNWATYLVLLFKLHIDDNQKSFKSGIF